MKKSFFVITALFASACTAFAQNAAQSEKPAQVETFSVKLLSPSSDSKLSCIDIVGDKVVYHVRGGFGGQGSYKFVANSEGKLVDLVIYSHAAEIEAFNAGGLLVEGSSVTSFGGESYQVSLPEWQRFFDEKVAQPIRIDKPVEKLTSASLGKDAYEFVGVGTNDKGKEQVVLRHTESKSLRMIDSSEFAVLPRQGKVVRLGHHAGKYYPTEEVKADGLVFTAVVLSEMKPSW